MKKNIHPKYFDKVKVICACGNSFFTGSTKETINIEVCSLCHPFYTGKEKIIDTAGRVEKFKRRAAQSASQKQKNTKTQKH